MKRRVVFAGLPVVVLLLAGLAGWAQPAAGPYKVLKKIALGGEGKWDYVTLDAEARRLYIPRGSHVMVMDVDREKIVGDIPMTKGVHGVALAPKHQRGFTSNGGDSTVTIFDLRTLKEVQPPVKVGSRPDSILYDPATDRVFTFNGGSKDATALDAGTGKVVGSISLGGRPEGAVADGKGTIYVNIEDKNELVAFDGKTLTVKSRWPLAPGETPTGLAMDHGKHRLFATCRNEKMVILDAQGGKVLATLPIGKGTDACVFDAKAKVAFSSNRDGTLTVVEEQAGGKYRVAQNVATEYGAKTMALDPKTHKLYLPTADFAKAAGSKKAAPVPGTFRLLVVGK